MLSKEGYEAVPDVELGKEDDKVPTAASYPGLPDDQAQLLANFDLAAASAKFDFQLPQMDPSELASQGESMLRSMVMPTVASLSTLAVGMLLGYEAQYSKAAAVVVLLFPYINSIIQFVVSISPLQKRLMSSLQTIFDKKENAEEIIQDGFDNVTRKVDTTVDNLQREVVGVLDPVRPTLDEASAHLEPLKRLDPDLDIPDVGDIDEEFDEAQGKVGARVAEAKKQMANLDAFTPQPLQSAEKFYWKIVFPILLCALLLQLIAAFASTFAIQTKEASTSSSSPPPTRRYLRRGLVENVVDAQNAVPQPTNNTAGQVGSTVDAAKQEATDTVQQVANQTSAQLDIAMTQAQDIADQVSDQVSTVKEDASKQLNATKAEVTAKTQEAVGKLDHATDEAKTQAQNMTAQAAEQIHSAKEDASRQFNATKAEITAKTQEASEKLDQAKEEARAQAQNITDQASAQVNAAKEDASEMLDTAKSEVANKAQEAKNQASEQINAAKNEVSGQLNAAKDQTAQQAAEMQAQVNDAKAQATAEAKQVADETRQKVDDAKAQAAAAIDTAKAKLDKAQAQMNATKAAANAKATEMQDELTAEYKPVIISVVSSYLMSLLQMALIFLLTNPKVKAWIVNKMISAVKDDASRRMRATGVPDMLHEVLVVRLGRIKQKLYKVFSVVGRIQKLLERLEGFAGMKKAAEKVTDTIDNVRGGIQAGKKKLNNLGKSGAAVDKKLGKITGKADKGLEQLSDKAEKASGAVSNFVGGLGRSGSADSDDGKDKKKSPLGGFGFGGDSDDGNKRKIGGGLGRFGRK